MRDATLARDVIRPDDFKIGKDLLINRLSSRTTKEDFFKEITYFALMCGFNELVPRPFPTRPQKMLDYDKLTNDQKDNLKKNPEFWLQTEIKTYLDGKIRILWENRSTLEWLKTLERKLESYGDIPNRHKVLERMDMFRDYHLYDEYHGI